MAIVNERQDSVQVIMSKENKRRLRARAAAADMTLSAYVRLLIQRGLDQDAPGEIDMSEEVGGYGGYDKRDKRD